jgi:small subunit ribosomal protein S8
MMTDPIADMLTRIRNASAIEKTFVQMPATKLKAAIAQVLVEEGFIKAYSVYSVGEDGQLIQAQDFSKSHLTLQIELKYGEDGERVIRHIERYSKPGRRVYQGYREIRRVLDGLGIAILSTSQGVMSDRKAKQNKLGGEILCTVW